MRWMKVRRPGLVFGVEQVHRAQQLLRRHRRPDLQRDRVADAAEVFGVCAVDLRGAHADPRVVRAQVEPAPVTRHLAGQRFLVGQQQRFVRGVEVDAVEVVDLATRQRLHEAHGIADGVDHAAVLVGQRRMAYPAEVPVFGVVQVGETAVDQRADEVHRHRRTRVRLDHATRIGPARCERELRRVDHVAAIAGQRDLADGLAVGRTRLGVLAGEPAHAHHRLAHAVHEHQAHLQQHLEAVGDDIGGARGRRSRRSRRPAAGSACLPALRRAAS